MSQLAPPALNRRRMPVPSLAHIDLYYLYIQSVEYQALHKLVKREKVVPPLRIELSHPEGNGFTVRCVSQLAQTAYGVSEKGFIYCMRFWKPLLYQLE